MSEVTRGDRSREISLLAGPTGSRPALGPLVPRKSRAGFTLLEVTISAVVLTVVFGGALTTALWAMRGLDDQMARLDTDGIGWGAMRRIGEELRSAYPETILPTIVSASPWIQYQRVTGMDIATANVTLGPVVTIALELAKGEVRNGLDDNGDGRADEGYVIQSEGGVPVRLAGNVSGLRFDLVAGGIAYSVDVPRKGRDETSSLKTFAQRVSFRN